MKNFSINMLERCSTIVLYVLFIGVFLYFLFSLFHIITTFAPDFNVYYRSGYDLLHHHSLYTDKHAFTNFGYPPVTALLYIPFALLPYQLAQGIYVTLSAGAIFLCVYFVLKIIRAKVSLFPFLIISIFTMLSFPTKFTLGMGQSNILAYASLLFSLLLLQEKKKQFLVIFFLGLSCLLKPLFIFMLLFFVLGKEWKLVFLSLLFLSGVTSIMFLFFPNSVSETIHYLTTVLPEVMNIHGRGVYYNQGFMGFIFRTCGEGTIQKYITEIISGIVLIITILMSLQQTKLGKMAILLSVLPLIDSLSWQHHFVFLLFPFVYIFFLLQKKGNILLWFLAGMSYALVSMNIKNPEVFTNFPETLILSHTFYGAFLLWIILTFMLRKKTNITSQDHSIILS